MKFLTAIALVLALGLTVTGQPQAGPTLVVGAQEKKPAFTESERSIINQFYKHFISTMAPASLDRSPLSPEIDRSLVPRARVPMAFEKKLEPLPQELRSKLSLLTGNYKYYKLGWHVLIVNQSDMTIVDIVRDAGWK
jgi:hypothetical protein